MSDRIDHATTALKTLGTIRGVDEATNQVTLAIEAQAHATLALVEQQRIANLIGLARLESENNATPTDAIDALWDRFNDHGHVELTTRPDIREGLGI